MEVFIFALGCAIPAALLWLFSHPTRDETDDEYMDRIFTKHPHGKKRLRQRVPEYGYSKTRKRRRSPRPRCHRPKDKESRE